MLSDASDFISEGEHRRCSEGLSGKIEAAERSGTGAKTRGLDPQGLEHGNKEVAQGRIVLVRKDEVLSVFEGAAGEEDGQVGVVVGVGVSKVAAHQHHSTVKQAGTVFPPVRKRLKQATEQNDVVTVGLFELPDFLR